MLSGLGNSVIHPADYAILSGSVDKSRLGRSFALHTFVGNIGFAAAPPVTAALALLLGWRETLLVVGGVGVPVVLAIVLQSRILNEQKREPGARPAGFLADMRQLLSRPILLFFALLHGVVDGRGRHPVLADHGIAQHARADARSRLLGADRLHGRGDVRHPARRLGSRPHRPPSRFCRRADRGRRRR